MIMCGKNDLGQCFSEPPTNISVTKVLQEIMKLLPCMCGTMVQPFLQHMFPADRSVATIL